MWIGFLGYDYSLVKMVCVFVFMRFYFLLVGVVLLVLINVLIVFEFKNYDDEGDYGI